MNAREWCDDAPACGPVAPCLSPRCANVFLHARTALRHLLENESMSATRVRSYQASRVTRTANWGADSRNQPSPSRQRTRLKVWSVYNEMATTGNLGQVLDEKPRKNTDRLARDRRRLWEITCTEVSLSRRLNLWLRESPSRISWPFGIPLRYISAKDVDGCRQEILGVAHAPHGSERKRIWQHTAR